MAYSDNQVQCIATLIAHNVPKQPFVFAFDNSLQDPIIYWSSYIRTARVPRSQTVDVLQAIHKGKSLGAQKIQFYRYPNTNTETIMCKGMREFLGVEPKSASILPNAGSSVGQWKTKYSTQEAVARGRTDGLAGFQSFRLGPEPNVDIRTTNKSTDDQAGTATVHRVYMMAAFALTEQRARKPGCGYNIGAILVAPNGTVLSWGVNTRIANYTFHAEVNAIQSYYDMFKAPVPDGSRLYTTLKPCKMCAGMIRACTATDGQIHVYYGQYDSGEHARNTALEGLLTQVGAQGSKALKTWDSAGYDTAKLKSDNLIGALDSSFFNGRRNGSNRVTEFLAQNTALGYMKDAHVALQRKVDKYGIPYFGNDNVRLILRHLAPFLASCGLPNWKGIEISPD